MVRKKNEKMLLAMNKTLQNITTIHKKTGISKSTLSSLLNNRSFPTMETAKAVARELKTNIEDLFDEIHHKKTSK